MEFVETELNRITPKNPPHKKILKTGVLRCDFADYASRRLESHRSGGPSATRPGPSP